jgi:hypothetical protein
MNVFDFEQVVYTAILRLLFTPPVHPVATLSSSIDITCADTNNPKYLAVCLRNLHFSSFNLSLASKIHCVINSTGATCSCFELLYISIVF